MLTMQEIKTKLEDRNLRVIAERTGVSYQTLWRLTKNGSTPSASTTEKISEYLERNS
jgi:transcriptional regulator with XRE-family HTH domain